MADLVVVENHNRIEESIMQDTKPAATDLLAMDLVTYNANGHFAKADSSTDTGEMSFYGIVTKATKAGMPVTAIRRGVVGGFDLDALAYGSPVYASETAGKVNTVAPVTVGAVVQVVGYVIPVSATERGTAYDKLLMVDPGSPTIVPAP